MGLLLLAAMGVAFVSRVAKNFQDYFINVITQRVGAALYADGISHSLQLPYQVFEDQRSGETLGKLQKVRTDVEKLIAAAVNVLFQTLVGIVFVMVYAFSVHWLIAPVYFSTVPLLGVLSSVLSRKIKTGAEGHRGGDDRPRGGDDGIAAEHRAREEPGPRRPGGGPAQRHHRARS